VSLGHDALAKLAAQWKEELTRSERFRKRLKKILAWTGATAAVLVSVGLILLVQKWHSDAERASDNVHGVLEARPDAVPYAIKVLEPLRFYAVKDLPGRFADATLPTSQRLHAACALAKFDLASTEALRFLADRITDTERAESINIVTALRRDKDQAIKLLRQRWDEESDPERKLRWATALLSLNETKPTQELLRAGADQGSRTLFIERFAAWPGDLLVIPTVIKAVDDADFRSGLCAALGKLEKKMLSNKEEAACKELLKELHGKAPDGAIHSASGWALRQWGVETPAIPPAQAAAAPFRWYKNSLGMIMLLLPEGEFRMGSDNGADNEAPMRDAKVKSFYLCDREVTVEQFNHFMNDNAYIESEKRNKFTKQQEKLITRDSPRPTCPMQQTGWEYAVFFCNWLSRRENLKSCYRKKGTQVEWEFDLEADGYRLPTEAEWEYACRAGSTTEHCSDAEAKYLDSYALFGRTEFTTEPSGSRLPNAWGLFDMHGNVSEVCHDRYQDHYQQQGKPATDVFWSTRGGSAIDSSFNLRSAFRYKIPAGSRERSFGFRVARGLK
jgi:formylglycine-generating enzyme required for sulfatase activity